MATLCALGWELEVAPDGTDRSLEAVDANLVFPQGHLQAVEPQRVST